MPHPGHEQKATWLKIRQLQPDWVLMWGWGVMNSTAIKEAAAVGFPMDHFIGVWWSGAEPDVDPRARRPRATRAPPSMPRAPASRCSTTSSKYVYDKGKGKADRTRSARCCYDRGLINAMIVVEAIRTAQGIYGQKPLTGEQVRDGLEHSTSTRTG